MASSSGVGSGAAAVRKPEKKQVWEETEHTFTEFGALSSDMKPTGNFFSRLWRRNKEETSNAPVIITASTMPSISKEVRVNPVVEKANFNISAQDTDPSVSKASQKDETESASPVAAARPETLTNLQDSTSIHSAGVGKFEESDEVLESQVKQRPQHRTLTSVLTRLGSILDQRSSTPQTYRDSDFKQYWMPDGSCRECYDCGDKFTTFRRRHHCRICGQIFCSKCCNQELSGKIIGYKGGIRVCTYCCHVVQRYAQQSTATGDLRALEDLRAISQWYNESGGSDPSHMPSHLSLGIDDLSPQIRGEQLPEMPNIPELSTPFDLTPQSEFPSQDSFLLESKMLIQDSVQLRGLWRQICDHERGVETQTLRIRLRTYTNCIVGRELIDWLIKNDKAATRDQALAIGQALLYAGYLECIGNQIPAFRDDFTLYRPGEAASTAELLRVSESMPTIQEERENNEPLWFQEIKKEDDTDSINDLSAPEIATLSSFDLSTDASSQITSEGGETKSAPSHDSRGSSFSELPKLNNVSTRDMTEEPLPRQDPSVHGLGDDFLKGAVFLGRPQVPTSVSCPTGWRNVDQLREENGEKLAYERLKKAHAELWQVLTRQLLSSSGLLLGWETVISSVITQISHFVRPDIRSDGDDMDIRNYVHIKKIAGGHKSETALFHGVVLSKNVAHKKMKTKITNPLILLLRGTIEFQRVENKFSSLEPQILQEKEFMRNCVMKMVAYRPNVVVVEKSVSRLAQEFLLEAGITLLYNVKLSVMERLARFTQAHIVPSIDGLVSKPNMGFCHSFRVHTYTLPNKETKTLTFFDGCATHLGCTVVLTGGTQNELRKVKQIMKFMTYTAYNSLLELCFCMDEFALPQPGADEMGQPFDALENSTSSDVSLAGDGKSLEHSMNTKDKEFTWSIKAEELAIDEAGIRDRSETNAAMSDYVMISPVPQDEDKDDDEDDYFDESMDGNLLVGEERRKALMMAGQVEDEVVEGKDRSKTLTPEVDEEKNAGEGEGYVTSAGKNENMDVDQDKREMSKIVEGIIKESLDDVFVNEQGKNTDSKPVEPAPLLNSNQIPIEINKSNDSDMDALTSSAARIMTSNTNSKEISDTLHRLGEAVEQEAKDTLTVDTVQQLKSRHASDQSSQRSTPEFRLDFSGPTNKPFWDGNPKLVGNIVCVIPASAMPYVPITLPNKEEDTPSHTKIKSRSTSGVQETLKDSLVKHQRSLDDANLLNVPDLDTSSSGDTALSDASFGSDQSNLTGTCVVAGGFLNTKIERANSDSGSTRSSTSKLTELTDGSDPLLGYQATRDESIFHRDSSHTLTEIKQTSYKRFRRALDGVHLSVSPYHKFQVPYLETDKGEKCDVRKFLPQTIFWSKLFDGESKEDAKEEMERLKRAADIEKRREKSLEFDGRSVGSGLSSKLGVPKSSVQLLHAHPLITCSLTEPLWDQNVQTILADFRARGGRILVCDQPTVPQASIPDSSSGQKMQEDSTSGERSIAKGGSYWLKQTDCLDVVNHQRLSVLFSSYSYKSTNHPFPCVYPWVVSMDFYGKNDITLGGFLERFCFRLQYACPSPTCEAPMTEHIRRFVHGNACVNVLLKRLDTEVPGARENILMWSWCRKCKQVTPVVPISSDTWSLSFAKYLDLRFHSSSFLRRATAEPCSHSLHHDHFQYFGHRNIVASFKYATISLKELALPSTLITIQPPIFDPDLLNEAVKVITYKAMDRYSQVLETTMKLKQEMTSDSQARTISDFLTEQQCDKKRFRDAACNIQMKIQELIFSVTCLVEKGQIDSDMTCHLFSIFDNIQLIKRHICEDVIKWNNKMQEFMVSQQKKSRLQSNRKDKEPLVNTATDELEKSVKSMHSKASSASLYSTNIVSNTPATAVKTASPPPGVGEPAATANIPHKAMNTASTILSNTKSTPTIVVGIETVVHGSLPGSHQISSTSSSNSSPSAEPNNDVTAENTPNNLNSEPTATPVFGLGPDVDQNTLPDDKACVEASDNVEIAVEAATTNPGSDGATSATVETSSSSLTTTLTTAAEQQSQVNPAQSSTTSQPQMPPPVPSSMPNLQIANTSEGQEDSTDGWFHDLKGATRRWLSTSSFQPLPIPFDGSEHHVLPMCEKVPITVYDCEPSSIVAYTLSSSDYLYRLREIQQTFRNSGIGGSHNSRSRHKSADNMLAPGGPGTDNYSETGRKTGMLSFLRGSSRDSSPQNPSASQQQSGKGGDGGSGGGKYQEHHSILNVGKKHQQAYVEAVRYVPGAEASSVGSGEGIILEDPSPSPEEKPKMGNSSSPSPHIETQFSDSSARFYCRVYFADQFRKLRKLILPGGENLFIRSLSRCKPWEAKGGKSGSSFSKTDDDRFILKQMSTMEVESFEKFGPQYFQYLRTCLTEEQPTALAKILGVYRIGFRNTQTNNALKQDVLVMENLFYNRRITQKFDLKGSMRNRLVNTSTRRAEEELVLLDENLLKSSVESPLYLRWHSKHVLRNAIASDSSFLSQNLVMDYSLLVGLDDNTQELVVGIIDYIRTFTWDKKLEMVVKSSGILGGQGKMPTVVSPQLYKSRFLEAMDRYFLHVPDHWTGLVKDSPSRAGKADQAEQKD